ncbi:Membrane attack complex component/perforin (MACPF) domain protein [Metarhizium album ARSEF 1941]|uniref:Membrane attack complex component/perforin (MACPF) domain protein n=1 Tax=Metarhizium album (strain ARSEF 1941) TaxID=1081103 RepID=A0A0B2WLC9_METAS|nr:Membrane attack complex component/perforin (MACPF) domain protein [Metarhizium album ARSEF 1941]KHN94504.1 Membrane attack complex component/perforin (MACPF) domain protein [Metarhizium album ARSEF 1941]
MSGEDQPVFTNSQLLGQSVNILPSLGNGPFDVGSLLSDTTRVISISKSTKIVQANNDKKITIPNDVNCTVLNNSSSSVLVVDSGHTISNSWSVNASASGSYSGVSLDASASYSFGTSLSQSNYYGFFGFEYSSFTLTLQKATIRNKSNVDPQLLADAATLPEWKAWNDGTYRPDKDTYDKYMEFFDSWGTHLITHCHFGARFSAKVEIGKEKCESKESFETNLKAEFSGVASIEAGAKKNKEYESYRNSRKVDAYVKGGDQGLAAVSERRPQDSDDYNAWAKSITNETTLAPVRLALTNMAEMLRKVAKTDEERKAAKNLSNAFAWLAKFQRIDGTVFFGALPRDTQKYEMYITAPPGILCEIREAKQQ